MILIGSALDVPVLVRMSRLKVMVDLQGKNSVAYLMDLADYLKQKRLQDRTKKRSKSLFARKHCPNPVMGSLQDKNFQTEDNVFLDGKEKALEGGSGGNDGHVAKKSQISIQVLKEAQLEEAKESMKEMVRNDEEFTAGKIKLEDKVKMLEKENNVLKKKLEKVEISRKNEVSALEANIAEEALEYRKMAEAKEAELRAIRSRYNWSTAQVEVLKKKESLHVTVLAQKVKRIERLETENIDLKAKMAKIIKIPETNQGDLKAKKSNVAAELLLQGVHQGNSSLMFQADLMLHDSEEGGQLQSVLIPTFSTSSTGELSLIEFYQYSTRLLAAQRPGRRPPSIPHQLHRGPAPSTGGYSQVAQSHCKLIF